MNLFLSHTWLNTKTELPRKAVQFLSLEILKTRQGAEQPSLIDPALRSVVRPKDLWRHLLTSAILLFNTIWKERERTLDPSGTSSSQLNLSKSEERTQEACKMQEAPNMNCCLSCTITPSSTDIFWHPILLMPNSFPSDIGVLYPLNFIFPWAPFSISPLQIHSECHMLMK